MKKPQYNSLFWRKIIVLSLCVLGIGNGLYNLYVSDEYSEEMITVDQGDGTHITIPKQTALQVFELGILLREQSENPTPEKLEKINKLYEIL